MARTCGGATRAHANAWVAPTWHESDKLAGDRPTGIVGPPYSIGALTQTLKGVLPYIPDALHLFSPCGTMFPFNFSFAGHVAERYALDQKLIEDRTLI